MSPAQPQGVTSPRCCCKPRRKNCLPPRIMACQLCCGSTSAPTRWSSAPPHAPLSFKDWPFGCRAQPICAGSKLRYMPDQPDRFRRIREFLALLVLWMAVMYGLSMLGMPKAFTPASFRNLHVTRGVYGLLNFALFYTAIRLTFPSFSHPGTGCASWRAFCCWYLLPH